MSENCSFDFQDNYSGTQVSMYFRFGNSKRFWILFYTDPQNDSLFLV